MCPGFWSSANNLPKIYEISGIDMKRSTFNLYVFNSKRDSSRGFMLKGLLDAMKVFKSRFGIYKL